MITFTLFRDIAFFFFIKKKTNEFNAQSDRNGKQYESSQISNSPRGAKCQFYSGL